MDDFKTPLAVNVLCSIAQINGFITLALTLLTLLISLARFAFKTYKALKDKKLTKEEVKDLLESGAECLENLNKFKEDKTKQSGRPDDTTPDG